MRCPLIYVRTYALKYTRLLSTVYVAQEPVSINHGSLCDLYKGQDSGFGNSCVVWCVFDFRLRKDLSINDI